MERPVALAASAGQTDWSTAAWSPPRGLQRGSASAPRRPVDQTLTAQVEVSVQKLTEQVGRTQTDQGLMAVQTLAAQKLERQRGSASAPTCRSGQKHCLFAVACQMLIRRLIRPAVRKPAPLVVLAARKQGRQTDWASGPTRQVVRRHLQLEPGPQERQKGLTAAAVSGRGSLCFQIHSQPHPLMLTCKCRSGWDVYLPHPPQIVSLLGCFQGCSESAAARFDTELGYHSAAETWLNVSNLHHMFPAVSELTAP
jgi:hypothetical protein